MNRLFPPSIGLLTLVRRSVSPLALACGLLGATLPAAHANLVVQLGIDGGSFLTLASGPNSGVLNFSYSNAVINLNGSANSNSPGTSTLANLIGNTLNISNLDDSAHDFELIVGATDFTAPAAPPTLRIDSHFGGSVSQDNAVNTAVFTSCIDPSNAQNYCGSGTLLAGPSNPNITTSSFSADAFLYTDGLLSLYSGTQDLVLHLGAGAEINTADNTTLNRVPEPASLALLGIGLLGSGLLGRRRR